MSSEELLVEGWLLNAEINADKPMRVAVAGAGAMGHGLALLMARAGHEVMLVDLSEQILDQATGSDQISPLDAFRIGADKRKVHPGNHGPDTSRHPDGSLV